jgi:autotransporter-associated beta strand protein
LSGNFTLNLPGPLSGTGNITNANNGSLSITTLQNVNSNFSGGVYFVADGTGIWRLTGTSQFGTGTLYWQGGAFNVSANRTTTGNYIANPIVMTDDLTFGFNANSAVFDVVFSSDSVTTSSGSLIITNRNGTANSTSSLWFAGAPTFSRPITFTAPTASGAATYLALGNPDGTQNFTGIISGPGGLRRSTIAEMGGTTILTEANTYSAGTEVDAGTLLVNNPTGSGRSHIPRAPSRW